MAALLLYRGSEIAGASRVRRDENHCPFSHEHSVHGGDSWSSSREGSLSRGAAVSLSLSLSPLTRACFSPVGNTVSERQARRDAARDVITVSSFDRIPLVALKRNATCDATPFFSRMRSIGEESLLVARKRNLERRYPRRCHGEFLTGARFVEDIELGQS